MKKKGVALLLAGMLTATTVAGCGKKEEPPVTPIVEWEVVDIQGYQTVFEVGDNFDINNIKINLKQKDGTQTKTIDVSAEMFKNLPDMTTTGEKTVTIEYDGKEYTFVVNVIDSKAILLQKFKDYLKNYQNGSASVVTGSLDVNLIAKFLKDTALVNENKQLELKKSDIDLANLTNDQKAFLNALYGNVTDAIIKSGLDISKQDVYNAYHEISTQKIAESVLQSVATDAMKNSLFYALFPNGIDTDCQELTTNLCEYIGIANNSVKTQITTLIKNCLLAIKDNNKNGVLTNLDSFFEIATQESLCEKYLEMQVIEKSYTALKQQNAQHLFSDTLNVILSELAPAVYDEWGYEVFGTTAARYRKQYVDYGTKYYALIEDFAFGSINFMALCEGFVECFNKMAESLEFYENNNYYFVEVPSQMYKTFANAFNIGISFANMVQNFDTSSTALNVEKTVFSTMVVAMFSTFTKLEVGGETSYIEQMNQKFGEINDILVNVNNYINIIGAKDRQALARFVSTLADNQVFYDNYNLYGTPYYITEVLNNYLTADMFTSTQEFESFKNAVMPFAKHVDEILTQVDNQTYELSSTLNQLATFGENLYFYANEYYAEIAWPAYLCFVGSALVKTDGDVKEKLSYIINNLGFDVYDMFTTMVYELFTADVDHTDEELYSEIYDALKTNIELILNNENLTGFNLAQQLTNVAIRVADESLTQILADEKTNVTNDLKALATEFDSFVVNGNLLNLGTAVKNSAQSIAKIAGISEVELLVKLIAENYSDFTKEKLSNIIQNVNFDVYESLTGAVAMAMGIEDDVVLEEIYEAFKTNINLVLGEDSVLGFNMFNSLASTLMGYYDAEIQDMMGDQKTEFVQSATTLANQLDQFVIYGNAEDLIEVVKQTAPTLVKAFGISEIQLITQLLSQFGIQIVPLINGALNSETHFEDVKNLLTVGGYYALFGDVNLEPTQDDLQKVDDGLITPVLNSIKTNGEYDVTNLKPNVVMECVYNTMASFGYEFDGNLKDFVLYVLNTNNGSVAQNFVNGLKDETLSKKLVTSIVDELIYAFEIYENQDKKELVINWVNGVVTSIANQTFNYTQAYEDLSTFAKDISDQDNIDFVLVGDFVLRTFNELAQNANDGELNIVNLQNILNNFRTECENSYAYVPKDLDVLYDVINYQETSLMNLISYMLSIKHLNDPCTKAITDVVLAFSNLSEDLHATIIKEHFASKVLTYIKENETFNFKVFGEYYVQMMDEVNKQYPDYIEYDQTLVNFVLTMLQFDENQTMQENLQQNGREFLQNNKTVIVDGLAELVAGATKEEDLIVLSKIEAKAILTKMANYVLGENVDVSELAQDIALYCEKYLPKEATTTVYAVGALIAVMGATNLDDVDFNELFAFVELPDGVTVDYNKLFNKLATSTTWTDCLKITKFNYAINENSLKDTFVGETYYLTIQVNFDAQIASVVGEVNLSIKIQ